MDPADLAAITAAIEAAAKPLRDELNALKAAPAAAAAEKAAADKAASDKAAADKAAADKAAADAAAAAGGGRTPEQNAEALRQKTAMDALTKQVSDLQAANKAAEDRAQAAVRRSILDGVLADYNFVTPAAKSDALMLLDAAVKTTDNGTFVAGDNLPVTDFAKTFFTAEKSYLLAPATAGGSGGQNGTGSGIYRGGAVATTEMIQPGMSAADRAAVVASIQAALPR